MMWGGEDRSRNWPFGALLMSAIASVYACARALSMPAFDNVLCASSQGVGYTM